MRTYIVILNWNGWKDTLRCLESAFALPHQDFGIVVCDNGSTDESLERILAWARGDATSGSQDLSRVPFACLSRTEAESTAPSPARLSVIANGANLGFAGGNNVGIRHALQDPECRYVWVLNNDTVLHAEALSALVDHCERHPDVGLCGSQVRDFEVRTRVQSFGGRLDRWFCTTHHYFCGNDASTVPDEPPPIDYVPGSSTLATRPFLEQVGLMSEDYFLYFEEVDWAERAKGKFRLAVCARSIVYHVGGASIGTPGDRGERGIRSEYYLIRGRALFARKFYRARLPVVYLGLLASVFRRLRQRKWARARVAACALLGIRPRELLPARA